MTLCTSSVSLLGPPPSFSCYVTDVREEVRLCNCDVFYCFFSSSAAATGVLVGLQQAEKKKNGAHWASISDQWPINLPSRRRQMGIQFTHQRLQQLLFFAIFGCPKLAQIALERENSLDSRFDRLWETESDETIGSMRKPLVVCDLERPFPHTVLMIQ